MDAFLKCKISYGSAGRHLPLEPNGYRWVVSILSKKNWVWKQNPQRERPTTTTTTATTTTATATTTTMAAGASKRLVVRLVSMAGTGHFYMTTRNKAKPALQLLKHDPFVNRHVLYKEQKVRKGEKRSKGKDKG